MISKTYLPAALLLVAFAQASSASDTDPHWSARIGTGQSAVTDSERRPPRAASTAPATADWSARIGTGRAVAESRSTPVAPSAGVVAPPTHWTAYVGTGHVSPGKVAEGKVPAEAKRLGEHPAALVAQNWSSRTIDPNTFIVRHPAGPIWVDASPAATENTVKIASAPKR